MVIRKNETHRVPLKYVWFPVIKDNGKYIHPDTGELAKLLKEKDTKHVFAVWHGPYNTDLFLMNKKELYNRFRKEKYYGYEESW